MHFLSIGFLEQLLRWDRSLFEKINTDWTNPVFDTIAPLLRNSMYWIPLYLFLIVFVLQNFKSKGAWWLLFFICTIAMTDMVGTYVFKHGFERIRPCNEPDMLSHLRLLVPCPSGYGFTSNHAANHFGMATFFFLTFRHVIKKWALLAFAWAVAICYAQVYVGIHYPLDIVGGMLLGLCFGIATATFFNKRFGFAIFGNQPD
jgi:membrane-associated phospholipid phosphatase